MNRKILSKEPQTTQVSHFSHDGRGIARIDGKTTFIAGALPGETVVFQYTRRKSDYDEGRTISVLDASLQRVVPNCAHFDRCGGCSMQHLASASQIHEKQSLLLDTLARIGHCSPATVLPPLADKGWHYRNKARLAVRFVEKKQVAMVGFREKTNPRYITDMSSCPVLNTALANQIEPLKALIESFERPLAITQIEAAVGDSQTALIFRNMEPLPEADLQQLRAYGQANGFWIYLQPGDAQSVVRFYPDDADAYLDYTLIDQGVQFKFHPLDFTQVNAGMNQKMVSKALELMSLQPNDVVLDLFCGLGNFSLPLAKNCQAVVGIEGCNRMVERASMNAKHNDINNAAFYCADLDKPDGLKSIKAKSFNKILLDPPRTGALEVVRQIPALNPELIVYVSCNPATLARDADILVNQHGYQFQAAGVIDMFPQTAHVESIALFKKG